MAEDGNLLCVCCSRLSVDANLVLPHEVNEALIHCRHTTGEGNGAVGAVVAMCEAGPAIHRDGVGACCPEEINGRVVRQKAGASGCTHVLPVFTPSVMAPRRFEERQRRTPGPDPLDSVETDKPHRVPLFEKLLRSWCPSRIGVAVPIFGSCRRSWL